MELAIFVTASWLQIVGIGLTEREVAAGTVVVVEEVGDLALGEVDHDAVDGEELNGGVEEVELGRGALLGVVRLHHQVGLLIRSHARPTHEREHVAHLQSGVRVGLNLVSYLHVVRHQLQADAHQVSLLEPTVVVPVLAAKCTQLALAPLAQVTIQTLLYYHQQINTQYLHLLYILCFLILYYYITLLILHISLYILLHIFTVYIHIIELLFNIVISL